jgi:acyl-coenzyme A thioesterase PaaI-like protein
VIRDKSKNEIINNVIMEIFTHLLAHKPLLGTPVEIVEGKLAIVKLVAIENMVVDERGLVHGGFTFGLADMVAEAKVVEVNKSKWVVEVEVRVDENTVLSGKLLCYVLEKHVLDR